MTDTVVDENVAEGVERAVQDAFTRAFTNFKGTASFSLKRSRGEYSNSDAEELGIHIQFDYSPDADDEEFLDLARDAIIKAKSIVYEGLGRDVENDAGGMVMEANTTSFLNAFPGAVIEEREDAQPDPQDSARAPQGQAAAPPYSKEDLDALKGEPWKQARNANASWARELFDSGHEGDFFDNATKKASGDFKATAYDFTHKTHRHVGFWVPKARS